jgi:hypothetical protein
MSGDFRVWAQSEVTRLRAEAERLSLEADALEKALKRFAGSPETSRPAVGWSGQLGSLRAARSEALPVSGGRTSKYEKLFQVWREASTKSPLTIDDMFRSAISAGHEIDRNYIRGIVFHQRKIGKVRQEGTGYVWI